MNTLRVMLRARPCHWLALAVSCGVFVAAAGDSVAADDRVYSQAEALARSGNVDAAYPLFVQFLSTVRSNEVSRNVIQAQGWLGYIDSWRGRTDMAVERYRKVMEQSREWYRLGMYESRIYYLDDLIMNYNDIFLMEWDVGRHGRCRQLLDEARLIRDEEVRLVDQTTNPVGWRNMVTRRQFGRWTFALMEVHFLWSAGRQREQAMACETIIREIESAGKGLPLDERNVRSLFVACSFLADNQEEVGNLTRAIELDERAGAFSFGRYKLFNSRLPTMRLEAAVARMRRDGPSSSMWQQVHSNLAVIVANANPVDVACAYRTTARAYYHEGRYEEAQQRIDQAVQIARTNGINQFMPKTLRWRARIQLARGNQNAAEKDILEAIDIMREKATKVEEPFLYQLFGQLLRQRGEPAEALRIWESGILLCQRFNKPYLELDVLCDILELHLKLGHAHEAWLTQQRIQKLLKEQPDIQPCWRQRLPDLLARYGKLRAAEAMATTSSRTPAAVTDCQAAPAVAVASTNAKVSELASGAEVKSGTNVAAGIFLQPASMETRVQADELATARFLVLNATSLDWQGELQVEAQTFACKWQSVSNDTVIGRLACTDSGASTNAAFAVAVPAGQVFNVYLQTLQSAAGLEAGTNAGDHRALLRWKGGESCRAEWIFGLDATNRRVAVVDASRMEASPFFHVPFYHSLHYRGKTGTGVNIKAVASSPCRIELYEEGGQHPLAIDANGDGDFTGQGDSLFVDQDGDRLPDLTFDATCDHRTVEVWVFPAGSAITARDHTIEVSIWAGEAGNLQLQSIDVLESPARSSP